MLKEKGVLAVLYNNRYFMKYTFLEFTINDMVDLIDKNLIDLNPSYQRNFIWTAKDQKELIDTIILEYPLPNFFIYKKPEGTFEMVDGQQRSKTIYRFVKGIITSSKRTNQKKFEDCNTEIILKYRLPVVLIEDLKHNESLKDYYVWINKKGVHLNIPEVTKSEFHDSNFLKLANEVLLYQNLIELDLFSEVTSKRMNDRAFIEELLAYLQLGIKEKKKTVTQIYKDEDISNEEYQTLKQRFEQIIDIIYSFKHIKHINKTRYKQKNDFYTLFNFLNENLDEDTSILEYQYKILLVLDGKDRHDRQYIRPTNDRCSALKNYAYHCVTQSNSKIARDYRLAFFNNILKNKSSEPADDLIDVLDYLEDENGIDISIIDVGNYKLMDVDFFKF
jgi:hypothetical protein